MAKVNISVDTESKECNVSIDGQTIDNVTSVGIYKESYSRSDPSDVYMDISITTKAENNNGVMKYTNYVANAQDNEKVVMRGEASVSSLSPAFIVKDGGSGLEEDISKFLS